MPLTRVLHYVPARPSGIRRLFSEVTFGVRTLFARWEKPDVVILVSPALISSAIAMLRVRWGFRRPASAVWIQDIYSLGIVETGAGGSRVAGILGATERWTARSATGVAVIHTRFKDYLVKRLSVPGDRVEVIRNWTHLPPSPEVDRTAERARLGWGENEVIVLHAGNQGTKQALENVVDAARLADRDGAPVRFVLLGGGSQREQLGRLAAGVERIQFIDPLPEGEYQRVMASADVLLVNEKAGVAEMAVPSKLTSYFSTGLPVVAATDAQSVTAGEIEASEGGLRIDAEDPAALVAVAVSLGADSERAARLGAAGKRYREAVLAEDAAIDHFDTWLQSLAARNTARINR